MKERIKRIVKKAIKSSNLLYDPVEKIPIEIPKESYFGDYSTTIAMTIAKRVKKKPKKIAEIILNNIEDNMLKKVSVAGNGYINFIIKDEYWHEALKNIEESFGRLDIGKNKRVLIEFVSANPTGPLHIGHGRGAVLGDVLANLFKMGGYKVVKEYYVNDIGNQIKNLGRSVFLRYLELYGINIDFPKELYQGSYIIDIAKEVKKEHGDAYVNCDEDEALNFFMPYSIEYILSEIKRDLNYFGVNFDEWFFESNLYKDNEVSKLIDGFKEKGLIYKNEGAIWFKASCFGDEKDRVIIKADGTSTYFASDIVYHKNKYDRGFDKLIDIWGADHHGYVPRLKAAIQAFKMDSKKLDIILVQMVNLLRDGTSVSMSTRSGNFIRLKEVLDEVGKDAARYFFLMRRWDSQLDFDLELAKKKNNENPVYYVQYAHARISSIFRKAKDKGIEIPAPEEVNFKLLKEEMDTVKLLVRFPEIIESAIISLEPHRLIFYIYNLAGCFHRYYYNNPVISGDPSLTKSRLFFVKAIQIVLKNSLNILGISAPEEM